MIFQDKRVLVTGGTGSLGKKVVHRILRGDWGVPSGVTVFSRDEAKQHYMRLEILEKAHATDEVIYQESSRRLHFIIGDMRDFAAVARAVRHTDIVINAAALKQVPNCEYFPDEAVKTNVEGAMNLVRAVLDDPDGVEVVVGISTDKACKPINVMGMTKALMERIFIEANLRTTHTRFVCVRYGNVIASRGSVIPLFMEQVARGGPVTITHPDMTRFLLTLDSAADTVFDAIRGGKRGEIYVPRIGATRIIDVARHVIGAADVNVAVTGIRPGEKLHEILVSDEEAPRTVTRGKYYVITPLLPELAGVRQEGLTEEYSSEAVSLTGRDLTSLLASMEPAGVSQ